MKKNPKVIFATEYILDEMEHLPEINLIKDCLNYCWHRAVKHNTPMSGKEKAINDLRRQFGIIK